METIRLLLFTTVWTAIWAAPLPRLSRRVEMIAGRPLPENTPF